MICDLPQRKTPAEVRSAPNMLIVDKNAEVIARTGGRIEGDPRMAPLDFSLHLRQLIDVLNTGTIAATVRLCDDTCLRGFPLMGLSGSYAVFVERFRHPMSLADLSARYTFSVREAEVISMLVRGATNHEIATALQIAETTVVSHVRNAGVKLGCTKRSSMVARINGFEESEVV